MRHARPVLKHAASLALGPSQARRLGQAMQDLVTLATYRISPRGRRSVQRLRQLRDAYRGRRCFIVGNGPSLQQMDLAPLGSEVTFGLNRASLMFDKLGFSTTFLVSVNRLVLEQSGEEILTAPVSERFIGWSSRRLMSQAEGLIFLRSVIRPHFSTDASRGVWEGATVTYVAMQLAYHLGIRDVILIGVDHSFTTKGKAHTIVQSAGPDPNHFDPSYFGTGYRWQLPDLETSEEAYLLAREAFARVGGTIRDATLGGKLEVFPKVRFDELFSDSTRTWKE